MSGWAEDELARVGAVDELQIAVARPDGSLRAPVTIWAVVAGDGLYVRSVRGREAAWLAAALRTHRARASSGGVERDVDLIEPDPDIAEQLDRIYRDKYRSYRANVVNSVLTPAAQDATFRLEPR